MNITDKDSHYGLPTINKSLEQFDTLELFPFKLLFSCGGGSVMSAHLSLPQLDTSRLPGSISQKATTSLLKEHLGFKGLVFTDALNMKGAANSFAPGTLDSMAFVAGNDVLEFSENAEMGISKIKKGITDGVIPLHTLEEKVKKILAYKYILGLHERQSIDLTDLVDSLNSPTERVLRQELYNNAITIAATEKGMLPLAIFDGGSTTGLLTAGVLRMAGNFIQLASNSPQSFAADPPHVTILSANPADITFTTPGATSGSHFGNLSEDGFGAVFKINSDVVLTGDLSGGDGFGGTIVGASFPLVLTLRQYFVSGPLQLDCGPWWWTTRAGSTGPSAGSRSPTSRRMSPR